MPATIYLDVDGVLNCTKTTRHLRCASDIVFVDTRKVLRLRDIVERTGAQIVLSSTWRFGELPDAFYIEREALNELRQEFVRLRCPLWVNVTPYIPRAKRWKEIYAHLMMHPEIENFVILDDVWEELLPYDDHLVVTTVKDGLTKERAELVIKMLGEKENG